MTFTESDLTELKAAYLSGASSLSINGRSVTFRSLDELKKVIQEVEASIAASEPSYEYVPKKVKATFTK